MKTESVNSEDNFKPPTIPTALPQKFRLLNVAYLTEISGNNEDFIRDVLAMFKDESNDFLTKVRMHFNQRDFYSIRRASHAMKPTGTYIGVNALSVLITNLEKAASCGDATVVGNLISDIEKMLNALLSEIDKYLATLDG